MENVFTQMTQTKWSAREMMVSVEVTAGRGLMSRERWKSAAKLGPMTESHRRATRGESVWGCGWVEGKREVGRGRIWRCGHVTIHQYLANRSD